MKKIRGRQVPPGRKSAAAIRYRREQEHAPRLVAKGAGAVAERIIEAAKAAGVPVHEDPDLVALLMTLNVNEIIPPDLYMAVAEVLAYIYRLNNRISE